MTFKGKQPSAIGIGIIGVGGIARQHLEAYRRKGFKVVGGYDSSTAAFADLKAEFGMTGLGTDLDAFLALPGLDVIDVAVPHYFEIRKPLFEALAKAGKPVFCQKPMAEDLGQAVSLVNILEKSGAPFMMHQSAPFVPGFIEAQKLIRDKERFGEPFYFQIENRGGLWFSSHPHWGSRSRWILNGMAIHHLALAEAWFGHPERVWSMTVKDPSRPDIKGENIAVIGLEYASGLKGLVVNNWSYRGVQPRSHPREEVVVQGTKGDLSGNIGRFVLKTFEPASETIPEIKGDWFPDAFGNAMEYFLQCLSQGKAFRSSGKDDLWVMATAEAAYASADQKKAISPAALLKEAGVL